MTDNVNDNDIVYTYQIIGTYDFPAPPQVPSSGGRRRTADVVFSMSAEGELTISVEPTPTGSDSDSGLQVTPLHMSISRSITSQLWFFCEYVV